MDDKCAQRTWISAADEPELPEAREMRVAIDQEYPCPQGIFHTCPGPSPPWMLPSLPVPVGPS